ncbi:MAG: RidA family protein [Breznakia sp.]
MFLQKIEGKQGADASRAYSPAVKLGDFVYVSAQSGKNADNEEMADDVSQQTKQAMENVLFLLAEKGLAARHIVKTTIFLTNMDDYALVNDMYATYFDGVYPACSVVEVSALLDAGQVAIECMVLDTLVYERQMQQGSHDGCGGCESDHTCGCSGCE